MMQSGKKVLRFTLKEAESVVASLFRRVWIPAYKHGDPRTQVVGQAILFNCRYPTKENICKAYLNSSVT